MAYDNRLHKPQELNLHITVLETVYRTNEGLYFRGREWDRTIDHLINSEKATTAELLVHFWPSYLEVKALAKPSGDRWASNPLSPPCKGGA